MKKTKTSIKDRVLVTACFASVCLGIVSCSTSSNASDQKSVNSVQYIHAIVMSTSTDFSKVIVNDYEGHVYNVSSELVDGMVPAEGSDVWLEFTSKGLKKLDAYNPYKAGEVK